MKKRSYSSAAGQGAGGAARVHSAPNNFPTGGGGGTPPPPPPPPAGKAPRAPAPAPRAGRHPLHDEQAALVLVVRAGLGQPRQPAVTVDDVQDQPARQPLQPQLERRVSVPQSMRDQLVTDQFSRFRVRRQPPAAQGGGDE